MTATSTGYSSGEILNQHLPVVTAVFTVNEDLTVTMMHANDAFERQFGVKSDLSINQRNQWLCEISHAAAATVDEGLSRVEMVPGSTRLVHVVASCFRIPENLKTFCSIQIVPIEVSEVLGDALKSRIQQLQDLVDNSAALMYVKDLSGKYIVVNDFFAKMFQRSASSIVGLTDHDLFSADCADEYRNNDKLVLMTGESMEFEEPYGLIGGERDPDDNHRWLSIKFPLNDEQGTPYALGAISTDITDRKRAESEARAAQREAERANRVKDEFLSRMSHELRTPLNAIIGFGQLLDLETLDPSSRDSARHILAAGNHLLALVDDILDLTWLNSGAPGFSVVELPAVVPIQEALDIIRPIALAADIEVSSDLHGALHNVVRGDARRLRQVLLNIFTNAIKYNREEGVIRIRCETHDDKLRLFVSDTGIGISARDQEKLFSPFSRVHDAPGQEGYGLGLAVSQRLVEQMGGSLSLWHSQPGEGSTFLVELDLVTSATLQADDRSLRRLDQPRVAKSDAKILHIDDTPSNVELVEQFLVRMHIDDTITATTGQEGVRRAREHHPDLILLDLHLTDMSGLEVLDLLRDDERTQQIPVIILSADATPSTIQLARERGVDAYLTKPLDIDEFSNTVSETLSRT